MSFEDLRPDFFQRDPVDCAKDLIGCIFRWRGCSGVIVETEAYAAVGDEACHTWSRPSARDFVARHEAGTSYVYMNYGVHWLFNVLAKSDGGSGFILFRALEPLDGLDLMCGRRKSPNLGALCSGPGKLSQALGINGSDHGLSFLQRPETGIQRGSEATLVEGPRIGITKAMDRPWRFGLAGSTRWSRPFPLPR